MSGAEALQSGDPKTVEAAQIALGVAAVGRLREWLKDPRLSPDERDDVLAVLRDILGALKSLKELGANVPDLSGAQ